MSRLFLSRDVEWKRLGPGQADGAGDDAEEEEKEEEQQQEEEMTVGQAIVAANRAAREKKELNISSNSASGASPPFLPIFCELSGINYPE
jgi:hypothetical protein